MNGIELWLAKFLVLAAQYLGLHRGATRLNKIIPNQFLTQYLQWPKFDSRVGKVVQQDCALWDFGF